MEIWIILHFGYNKCCAEHLGASFCIDVFSWHLDLYLRLELLGPTGTLCLGSEEAARPFCDVMTSLFHFSLFTAVSENSCFCTSSLTCAFSVLFVCILVHVKWVLTRSWWIIINLFLIQDVCLYMPFGLLNEKLKSFILKRFLPYVILSSFHITNI